MPGSVIVSSARTPIGKLSGALAQFSGADLGGIAIKAALERAGLTGDQIDHVIMGQVLLTGSVIACPNLPKGGCHGCKRFACEEKPGCEVAIDSPRTP